MIRGGSKSAAEASGRRRPRRPRRARRRRARPGRRQRGAGGDDVVDEQDALGRRRGPLALDRARRARPPLGAVAADLRGGGPAPSEAVDHLETRPAPAPPRSPPPGCSRAPQPRCGATDRHERRPSEPPGRRVRRDLRRHRVGHARPRPGTSARRPGRGRGRSRPPAPTRARRTAHRLGRQRWSSRGSRAERLAAPRQAAAAPAQRRREQPARAPIDCTAARRATRGHAIATIP